eukprot:889782-Alexandrium_andersonii.AAC.1
MSASLVGSEMCIRDRPLLGKVLEQSSPDRPEMTGQPVRFGRGRSACREAVSYTHLTLPTICSV